MANFLTFLVDFGIIISLVEGHVEESVNYGIECGMFVLCRVICSVVYDGDHSGET